MARPIKYEDTMAQLAHGALLRWVATIAAVGIAAAQAAKDAQDARAAKDKPVCICPCDKNYHK